MYMYIRDLLGKFYHARSSQGTHGWSTQWIVKGTLKLDSSEEMVWIWHTKSLHPT